MKKIFSILILALILCSCSNSEDSDINSDLLQRVDFFPEKTNATRWYFNSKGLLNAIKKPDGTLLEEFVYDSKNNVIKDIKYSEGGTFTYDVTYDSNNIITSINGRMYQFNTDNNRYWYKEEASTFNCEVNEDNLAIKYLYKNTTSEDDSDDEDEFEINYEMNYENGNMVFFRKAINNDLKSIKSFGYADSGINDNGNPLNEACLPVLRLKSLIEPDFFIEGISSRSLLQSVHFGEDSAINYNYGMLVYPNNHLESQGIEVYNGADLIAYYSFTRFYYQGQRIP